MKTIRYNADAEICMTDTDGQLTASTQDEMDTLPLGADLTDDEIDCLDS
jgi:hypothetical protein